MSGYEQKRKTDFADGESSGWGRNIDFDCFFMYFFLSCTQHAHPASRKNSALRVGFLFLCRPPSFMLEQYTKPPLNHKEQLQLLKDRGLLVEDDTKALHLLHHISYYRLSGYWHPLLLQPKHLHRFKPNASFNNAFKLYCFDRELRQLVLGEIEKIEVAVRAQMINTLSQAFGPTWYADTQRFNNNRAGHDRTLQKLLDDFRNSQEEFIVAFRKKYSDNYPLHSGPRALQMAGVAGTTGGISVSDFY